MAKKQQSDNAPPTEPRSTKRVMPFRMNPLRKNRMGLSLNKSKYLESEARTGVDYAYHLSRRAERVDRTALRNPNRPRYGHLVIQVGFFNVVCLLVVYLYFWTLFKFTISAHIIVL